jgi:hypothetical protein
MKFTMPLQDPHQAARDAAASLLLRVPSLVSNEGKDVTISPQQQQPSQQPQAFYGSTPPVFVNYRSDDIMRQQQHHHHQQQMQQQQQHGRPLYNSPIRIRSARGARRQMASNPANTSAPTASSTTTTTGGPATATAASTTVYSVSTRGRRNAEHAPFHNSGNNKRKLPLTTTAIPTTATTTPSVMATTDKKA